MEALDRSSILLVEDDHTARDILASMLALRFPQITFHLADNGKAGLEMFREFHPAVIITDLNMPVMNGIKLAEEVRALASEVKLIVLTAFSDKSILESSGAAEIGIDHFLMKPVDYRKLLNAIQDCLAVS